MRRNVVVISLLLVVALGLALFIWRKVSETKREPLYRGFQEPPWEYTIYPYWFWNAEIKEEEVTRQIEDMVSKGIRGAIIFPFEGLQTPYLSEEWWKVIAATIKKASEYDFFSLGFADEYNWPSGEARDIWMKDRFQSRVLATDPSFQMTSLFYRETAVKGPKIIDMELPERIEVAIAARQVSPRTIDEGSLVDITEQASGRKLSWKAPDGDWLVLAFYLQRTHAPGQGAQVDLMNEKAVQTFINIVYDEYYKRFGPYFGKPLQLAVTDTEGNYGYRIAWTPRLFSAFSEMKGYDLRKYLPLLVYDGGRMTEKVRCDYLDVVSELFTNSFMKQITDWCEQRKLKHLGSFYESPLRGVAAHSGDFFRLMRALSILEVDGLEERGRDPRDYKEAASVAHYEGKRYAMEHGALHGWDSYLSPEKMRKVINMIANWGINLFIQHGFNYNKERRIYPPDINNQPFWRYFKHLADYMRRISYMNTGGKHVAQVLLFHPIESIWGCAAPIFANPLTGGTQASEPVGPRFSSQSASWSEGEMVDEYYDNVMRTLIREGWDYDVVDHHYLAKATITDKQLSLAGEAYRVLVLPPLITVRRQTMTKIKEFYESGGTVIAIKRLPTNSMEAGRGDPEISSAVETMFGAAGAEERPYTLRENNKGGKAYFVKEDITQVVSILEKNLKKDVRVLSGDPSDLYYIHWQKGGRDIYWVVNDSDRSKENLLLFSVDGRPEKWNALTGDKEDVYYRNTENGTEIRILLDPWDAYYVVFEPRQDRYQAAKVVHTNLERYVVASTSERVIKVRGEARADKESAFFVELQDGQHSFAGEFRLAKSLAAIEIADDKWYFKPDSSVVEVPYARSALAEKSEDEGEKLGWHGRDFDDSSWSEQWLSSERFGIRDWWIIGPFPNEHHKGVEEEFPPEKEINLNTTYKGAEGLTIKWRKYSSPSYIINLDQALDLKGQSQVTAYAFSYVYSPKDRKALMITVIDNSGKVWINGENVLAFHKHPVVYLLMRDSFAHKREVSLRKGWNEILIKINKAYRRFPRFTFRLTEPDGRPLEDIIYSTEKKPVTKAEKTIKAKSKWYRLRIPPGTIGIAIPRLRYPYKLFINSEVVNPNEKGKIMFKLADEVPWRESVLAIKTDPREEIIEPIRFISGKTRFRTGSWTNTGLQNYSGSATYETEFTLSEEYLGKDKKLLLDCGKVGVVAEVWVNGQHVGDRIWSPYSLNITPYVKKGKNSLKIIVANTDANERAVGEQLDGYRARPLERSDLLKRIDLNGLLGPVKIIPYIFVELECGRK